MTEAKANLGTFWEKIGNFILNVPAIASYHHRTSLDSPLPENATIFLLFAMIL